MSRWPSELADECFARLFRAAWTDGQLDGLTREWLQRGMLASLREDLPLEAAMGLAAVGRPSIRGRLLQVRRDQHLAAALEAVAIGAEVGEWPRCVRLAGLLPRFLSDVWPRYRGGLAPDPTWPVWKREACRAAQTGLPLPSSAKGLHNAWKRNGAFSLPRGSSDIEALARFL